MKTQIEAFSSELYAKLGLTTEDTLNISVAPCAQIPFRVNVHLGNQLPNAEFMRLADSLVGICDDNISSAYHYHGTIFHIAGRAVGLYNNIVGVNGLDWMLLCGEIPIIDGVFQLDAVKSCEEAATND